MPCAPAGSEATTLKDGRRCQLGTFQTCSLWPFEGAVLHNRIRTAFLGNVPQMCHRIGENFNGLLRARALLKKCKLRGGSLKEESRPAREPL